jgi:hypothetical protein
MNEIRDVILEFLRPGPAHNQLLSPLTPYIALCGADGPVTVSMPFEHRHLLNRLERLRYSGPTGDISRQQRESEVREIGEALGRVLGQVPALLSELGNAFTEDGRLVNLRLSLSAFELGMVPFEFAISPDGFPQSGSPLFLQTRAPISISREVRRGRPLQLCWDRPPRILFAFASVPGLPPVPAYEHLRALRRAVDPWVHILDDPKERIADFQNVVTVLEDATLRKIREQCAATEYTHVHILAHGAPRNHGGQQEYGVALNADDGGGTYDVVDGERLGMALMTRDASGKTRNRPTVVTLATCDSANINTVLTPGGSIAHQLHATEIPWVIASQLPLYMRASWIAAEILYSGLLRGDDPRWVLYDLRQRLRTDSPDTHDWASIVAYSTVSPDFNSQVRAFRSKQTRRKLEIKFDRADAIVSAYGRMRAVDPNADTAGMDKELDLHCQAIRDDLRIWRSELDGTATPAEQAERLGMSAASEKRISILYRLVGDKKEQNEALTRSRSYYRTALEAQPVDHWLMTQFLSLSAARISEQPQDIATQDIARLASEFGDWWTAARRIAQWELEKQAGAQQAWPLSTLAELALLGRVYAPAFDQEGARKEIVTYCQKLREVTRLDPFPVDSTRRQFRRYLDFWKWQGWDELAEAAVNALEEQT